MRLLPVFLLLFALSLPGCGDFQSQNAPKTLENLKHIENGSLVDNPTVYFIIDPETALGCTATAVLDGRALLTAQHCKATTSHVFTNANDPAAAAPDGFTFEGIQGVLHHPTLDISLIILKKPVEDFAEMAATPIDNADGPYQIVGYGGGPHYGHKAGGAISRLSKINPETLQSDEDINAAGGDSGGPLFQNDILVGVMTNANNRLRGLIRWTKYVNVNAVREWAEEGLASCSADTEGSCQGELREIPSYGFGCAAGILESPASWTSLALTIVALIFIRRHSAIA